MKAVPLKLQYLQVHKSHNPEYFKHYKQP